MSESQQKMILDILATGQRVTVLQLSTKPVYSMYGGKRISELKEKGINIKDHWVDAENGKRYKEYFLPKSEINKLKRGTKDGKSKKRTA
tara:strand:- start:149 stop:415 length:267 start_codon:yes stop_codon:yes gene_type:complete